MKRKSLKVSVNLILTAKYLFLKIRKEKYLTLVPKTDIILSANFS